MVKDSLNMAYSFTPNTLPETSGYRYVFSHMGTMDAATVFANVAARIPGQTNAGVELVWNSGINVLTDYLTKYQYKVNVNGNTFELEIPGSTDSINGTPTEGAYVSITPSSAIRNAASGITPVYSGGDEDEPKVMYVENLTTHERGEIAGTEPFRVAGTNIAALGDGESLKVIAADGTEAVAEVTEEDGLGVTITAHLPAALPPGKGKVILLTHGKRTPEGELQQCVKSVTILAGETPPVAPPVVTGYLVDGQSDTPIDMNHSQLTVNGSGLATASKVQFFYLAGERPADEPFYEKDVTPGTDMSFTTDALGCETVDDSSGYFRVITADGTSDFVACSFAM